jgi:hypothetical protein
VTRARSSSAGDGAGAPAAPAEAGNPSEDKRFVHEGVERAAAKLAETAEVLTDSIMASMREEAGLEKGHTAYTALRMTIFLAISHSMVEMMFHEMTNDDKKRNILFMPPDKSRKEQLLRIKAPHAPKAR